MKVLSAGIFFIVSCGQNLSSGEIAEVKGVHSMGHVAKRVHTKVAAMGTTPRTEQRVDLKATLEHFIGMKIKETIVPHLQAIGGRDAHSLVFQYDHQLYQARRYSNYHSIHRYETHNTYLIEEYFSNLEEETLDIIADNIKEAIHKVALELVRGHGIGKYALQKRTSFRPKVMIEPDGSKTVVLIANPSVLEKHLVEAHPSKTPPTRNIIVPSWHSLPLPSSPTGDFYMHLRTLVLKETKESMKRYKIKDH